MSSDTFTAVITIATIMIILFLLSDNNNKFEGFSEILFENVHGHNPYIYPEYRRRKNYMPIKADPKKTSAHRWHTRLPSLPKQRYLYYDNKYFNKNNDQSVSGYDPYPTSLKDRALLTDLPLQLKNRWHAVIDEETAKSDYLWKPDIKTGRMFSHDSDNKRNNYCPTCRSKTHLTTDPQHRFHTLHNNREMGLPHTIDTKNDLIELSN
jgi:hypothetical protein